MAKFLVLDCWGAVVRHPCQDNVEIAAEHPEEAATNPLLVVQL